MSQTSADQLLWDLFLQGDNNSLETIYTKYFDELYRYGMKWLEDEHLVEDTIQDLYIKLIRTRNNLAKPASVKYYLFRSFKSITLDKLRAAKKYGFAGEVPADAFSLELSPENEWISREENDLVREKINVALSQLTVRQREALYLRYIEGFSFEQVSEILEITTKATYKLIARSLEAMRHYFPVSIFTMLVRTCMV